MLGAGALVVFGISLMTDLGGACVGAGLKLSTEVFCVDFGCIVDIDAAPKFDKENPFDGGIARD